MGTDKLNQPKQTAAQPAPKADSSATPKKKFKLHRMTKKELLETRIPVYDYIL